MMKSIFYMFGSATAAMMVSLGANASELVLTCKPSLACQKGQCLEGEKARGAAGDVTIAVPLSSAKEISVTLGKKPTPFERVGTNGVYVEKADKNMVLFFEYPDAGGAFNLQFVRAAGSDWLGADGQPSMRIAGTCTETKLAE